MLLDPDEICTLETQRLHSLVVADMDTALRLHAPDYQLIRPIGEAYSRDH